MAIRAVMGKPQTSNYSKILTEISVDNLNFQVTWNPFEDGSCILWFRDVYTQLAFTALGKFFGFDKKKVLEFVVKYATNPTLRSEIAKRRFERKIDSLNLSYFERIELQSYRNREAAYRSLFDLDHSFEPADLSAKRRMMAKRFHPDAGGNDRAMTLINEAYDYLSRKAGEAR